LTISESKVVVEEVGCAAGEQPDHVVEDPLVHPSEARAERRQREQLLGILAEQVRRRRVEQWLDRVADHLHVVRVLLVGVRVVPAVPGDLLEVLVVVLPEPQVVAVLHRRERRGHQQRQEAVLGQFELVDDVRPEKAQRVRERREAEARIELLGDRGATDQRSPLEDEGLESGLGQVRPVGQAVVPAADDDRVIGPLRGSRGLRGRGLRWRLRLRMSGGLPGRVVERQAGRVGRDVFVAMVHVDLQSYGRPGAASAGRTRARAMWRWRTGEYMKLVV
jgi:hypothetical protein